ncbi:hypothetical protein B0T17DRAFT_614018 [Bombardia bombarda]|uniref:Uncharacterized protein n=1 Tax=Bombardia bombarda TaxID=252184 RepID=A0AA39XNS0_9PEZI|nr:hypothetical protein B0T17DRAFT_614018 [Bombardia bombarda]
MSADIMDRPETPVAGAGAGAGGVAGGFVVVITISLASPFSASQPQQLPSADRAQSGVEHTANVLEHGPKASICE